MAFNGVPQTDNSADLKNVKLIGTVVDNNDPDMCERIRVTIPKLFDGDPKNLPWVSPNKDGWFPNNLSHGCFGLVPPIGTKVIVVFQQGKPLYPMYEAYPHVKGQRPGEFTTNYLKRYGFKDPEGNLMFFDTTPGANPKFFFQHTAGVIFKIDANGDVTVTTTGKMNQHSDGDMTLTSNGNININAQQNVSTTAGQQISGQAGANINLHAAASLALTADSTSTMTSTGSFTITAAQINLD